MPIPPMPRKKRTIFLQIGRKDNKKFAHMQEF
jgi:hypothetical protein